MRRLYVVPDGADAAAHRDVAASLGATEIVVGIPPALGAELVEADLPAYLETEPAAPFLSTDRRSIPADGATGAVVTYCHEGPDAPVAVEFRVNGAPVAVELVGAEAAVEVSSSVVGPVDVVCVGLIVRVDAVEVPPNA